MESRTSRPIAMMARLFIAVRLRVIIGLYKIQCPLVWTKSKGLTVRFKSLWELAIRLSRRINLSYCLARVAGWKSIKPIVKIRAMA